VRTNSLSLCSLPMASQALLTSEKYYFSYTFRSDTRNSSLYPSSGALLECRGELSTVNSCIQSTADISGKAYLRLAKDAVLEMSAGWQGIKALNKGNCHINDRARGSFVKGFRAYGERTAPGLGDDLGVSSLLNLEAKLSFYNSPLLNLFSLTPFLYANLFATNSNIGTPQLRGSCGLGLEWITHFGHVELSYAARVVSKPGDLPAQVQILLSE